MARLYVAALLVALIGAVMVFRALPPPPSPAASKFGAIASPGESARPTPGCFSDCCSACAVLSKNGCEEATLDDAGLSCLGRCDAKAWRAACVSRADTVGQIRACGLPCAN